MATTGRRATAALLASALVAVLVGCGSEVPFVSDPNSSVPHATAGDPTTPISLDGVTGELVTTRQRDLLDRGLINVMSRNESGTDILDAIRAEQCATRRFQEGARTRFDGTSIVDGTVVTRLVVEPISDVIDLAVSAVAGTILVGVHAPSDWDGLELQDEPVVIPLTFVVNRCDPHALAEVTKRFGLDLDVSVDGAAPVQASIDIGDVSDDLDVIIEQCQAALAQE